MIDDDYDDYEGAAPVRTGWTVVVYRWLLGIGGAAALAFGGVYLHYNFSGGGTVAPQQGGVPLIRAAKGPVKVRPADPGGRDVPNKDLDVYKEFDAARLKRPPGTTSEDLLAPGKPRPAEKREPVPEGPVCHPVPTLLADTGRYRRAAETRHRQTRRFETGGFQEGRTENRGFEAGGLPENGRTATDPDCAEGPENHRKGRQEQGGRRRQGAGVAKPPARSARPQRPDRFAFSSALSARGRRPRTPDAGFSAGTRVCWAG